MMQRAKLIIEVGILFCSKIRDFLNQCKFDGLNIEFIESSGLISREFCIKGNVTDIINIKNHLSTYSDE